MPDLADVRVEEISGQVRATTLGGTLRMNKTEMTAAILDAKQKHGLTWAALAGAVDRSPVYITSACFGMNSLAKETADKVVNALDLGPEVSAALQSFPHKHWDKSVPTDPVIYRFHEMINVYGTTLKELIHEQFGDGIMSAIDFTMEVGRLPDPAGDRVKIDITGKFLKYKAW